MMNRVRLMMWSELRAFFYWSKVPATPEPTDSRTDDLDFIPTPNTELRLNSLNLSADKVQRIFLDHAYRHNVRDYYEIMKIRGREIKNKEEFLPEELEQLRIEHEIIGLLLESERRDFIARCGQHHIELLRKVAKTIISLNPLVDKNKNPDLEIYWNENKHKLLKPLEIRLNLIKEKILKELQAAGILPEEVPQSVTTGTTETIPPKLDADSDDIVMDSEQSETGKTEGKKSSLNFN